jgi:small subunit ribosomal protein S1
MVNKSSSDPDTSFPDEGWWASVLAEEVRQEVSISGLEKRESQKENGLLDWEQIKKIFKQDEILSLKVCGSNKGGLLVEGHGISGFVPCSHLTNIPPQIKDYQREEYLAAYIGKTIYLKIIECNQEENRIIMSERAARAIAGKRTEIFFSLQPGQVVVGEVTNVTEFGAFIDLGGVEGLIHISELSWGRVIHPGQIVQLGQRVEVMVLDVNPEKCRIGLSLKRRKPNPWENAEARYPLNSMADAVITMLVPFGAFARLEEGLEGLVHTSQIPLPENHSLQEFLKPDQPVQVRIIQVDASRQRLGLSMKPLKQD